MDNETVTLKEYFEKLLSERDRAIQIELKAAKEAVKIAEDNAQKWREQANEWRSAMNDKDRLLMQRSEFVTYAGTNDKTIEEMKTRLDNMQGSSTGIQKFIGWIIAAIAITGFVIAIRYGKQ